MKLRYKVTGSILVLILVALASTAIVLSHDSPCGPASVLDGKQPTMKAIVYRCYGSTDVLKLEDVLKPVPADDEILVRVRAASVNPLDWHYMRGEPYIMRLGSGLGAPKSPQMGVDFSGTVESVGKQVRNFKPGDAVFGGKNGAFAEYVSIRADRAVVPKPENLTFQQVAAVPIAAVTALQALRDKGQLKPGQKVLVNGASGGVGTFAVQIAKAMGAEVTGVCSTRNLEMVKSIGADYVIDYTKEDYTESGQMYDLIIDNVGNHSLMKNRAVLSPQGKFVIIGGKSGKWLGPLVRPVAALLLSPFVDQEFGMMLASMKKEDLATLGDLMQNGKVTPVIDRHYALNEVPEAIRYSEEGHARGKIIIDIE